MLAGLRRCISIDVVFLLTALDEGDIALLKTYVSTFQIGYLTSSERIFFFTNIVFAVWHQGQSTYSRQIKQVEDDIQQLLKKINELTGRRLNLLIGFYNLWCYYQTRFFMGCAGWMKAFLLNHISIGIKESDTGLAPPALWDLAADKQTLQSEQPLQVAR